MTKAVPMGAGKGMSHLSKRAGDNAVIQDRIGQFSSEVTEYNVNNIKSNYGGEKD